MHQRIQLECGINASDVVLWKIQHRITIIIISQQLENILQPETNMELPNKGCKLTVLCC